MSAKPGVAPRLPMEKGISTALISVYSKEGLDELLDVLKAHQVSLLATGGTYQYLQAKSLKVKSVEEYTGYPNLVGGRVKSLHPLIFGGILCQPEQIPADAEDMQEYGIEQIDLVIVDLYPFEQALLDGASEAELIEKIDIGGVSLIRAAAKNYKQAVVISDRAQYGELANLLRSQECKTTEKQRLAFAAEAFTRTAAYDDLIASHLLSLSNEAEQEEAPEAPLDPADVILAISETECELRYGENPHQQATFCGDLDGFAKQLQGKPISYNNILDIDAGVSLIDEFASPACVVIKHGTPCGVASVSEEKEPLSLAWKRALASDPQSAFGGIWVLNRPVDSAVAKLLREIFFEVCVAPEFEDDALRILREKRDRILLQRQSIAKSKYQLRSALNGVLVQEREPIEDNSVGFECVTTRTPRPEILDELRFANRIVKHCKSNAIVLTRAHQLIGVGAGETSRVSATRHAIENAHRLSHETSGAVLASDAFFPFPDSLKLAAEAGVEAIIQPGGSRKDTEIIEAANALGLAMIFTGIRHFKH